MRLRKTQNNLTLNVVAGTSAVLLHVDLPEEDTKDLLGFYIQKKNLTTGEEYDITSIRYFEATVDDPKDNARYSTKDHPWQSFMWEDFYVQLKGKYQYTFTAVRGKPGQQRLAEKVSIDVSIPSPKKAGHEVYFNRGVVGSQAYASEFKNQRPDQIEDLKEKARAYKWLSKGLKEALLGFIAQAKDDRYQLRCCFYEFEYQEVLLALKEASKRGADVKIIYDSRKQRDKNNKAIAEASLPKKILIPRASDEKYIQHNKYMVLLMDKEPVAVWTGSTNITEKGIFGQCNTGHLVRNADIAKKYLAHWNCLKKDPDNENSRLGCLKIQPDIDALEDGSTVVFFSPREKTKILKLYSSLIESSSQLVCGMFPFSFNKGIKAAVTADTEHLKYIIIDKKTKDTTLETNDHDNVIIYGGVYDSPIYHWLQETNAGKTFKSGTNYIHNKIILIDPLSDDPIVITGSANFSDNSILQNDENTLVLKGNTDLADLYFTEFARVFNHYSTRSDTKKLSPRNKKKRHNPNHLWESPEEWVGSFYRPTALKAKRKNMFDTMSAETV